MLLQALVTSIRNKLNAEGISLYLETTMVCNSEKKQYVS